MRNDDPMPHASPAKHVINSWMHQIYFTVCRVRMIYLIHKQTPRINRHKEMRAVLVEML